MIDRDERESERDRYGINNALASLLSDICHMYTTRDTRDCCQKFDSVGVRERAKERERGDQRDGLAKSLADIVFS